MATRFLRVFTALVFSIPVFAQSFTQQRTTTGARPTQVVKADFDGDDVADLAILNSNNSYVSVYIGLGDGTFRWATNQSVASPSLGIVLGDFNRDGRIDVVSYSSTDHVAPSPTYDTITFMQNMGAGHFNRVDHTWPNGFYRFTTAPAVGDFNNDGKLDLAVASAEAVSAATVIRLRVIYGDGTGGFNAGVDTANLNFPNPNGSATMPIALAPLDFDLDGKTDLAMVTGGGGDVSWGDLTLIRNLGSNNFTPLRLTTLAGFRGLQALDADSDGWTDLYAPFAACQSSCRGFSIFLNKKAGAFSEVPYSEGGISEWQNAAIADFDLNGRRELAIVRGPSSVNADATNTVAFFDVVSGALKNRRDVKLGSSTEILGASGLAVADWNRDGKLDMVVTDSKIDAFTTLLNKTSFPCTLKGTNLSMTVCSPSAGMTVGATFHITAYGESLDSPITAISIYDNGVKTQTVKGTQRLEADYTTAVGSHRLTIKGWNALGQVFSDTRTITVGSGCSAPSTNLTVKICSPVAGAVVSSPVQFDAWAMSNASAVVAMQLYVDHVKVVQQNNTNHLLTTWSLPAGTHAITVKAWNAAGQNFSSSQTITVR